MVTNGVSKVLVAGNGNENSSLSPEMCCVPFSEGRMWNFLMLLFARVMM